MKLSSLLKGNEVLHTIIDGIIEKKGKEVVCIDLSELDFAICSYFVICHGDSTTHVSALADFLEHDVASKHTQSPWSVQGKENSLWVILDFGDIFVHIFKKDVRSFYNLEDLWADGNVLRIDEFKKQIN